jgi:hypothetical protein
MSALEVLPQTGKFAEVKSEPSIFATKPFDLKQENLPVGYIGHSPDTIFNALAEAALVKFSFETSKDFNERFKKDGQSQYKPNYSAKMGAMTLDAVYAFKAENTVVIPDEKSKIIKAYFSAFSSGFQGVGYSFRSEDKQLPSFVGQNAYGAQVSVKAIERSSFELIADNGEKFLSAESIKFLPQIGANFDYTAEASQQAKDIKALIICKLKEPYGKMREDLVAPTLSSPTQYQIKASAFMTEILEIWFYNPKTGKVFYKQKPI